MKRVRIYWSGDRFITEDLDMKQNDHVNQYMVDTFHTARRDILVEMEELFDKVDDGYVTNSHTFDMLTSAIKELEYILGLLKITKTNL